MIKLAVFDIDGTLYDHKHQCIYESSIKAIKNLKKQGVKIVIATGRPHFSVNDELFAVEPDYLIGFNGHIVLNQENQIISSMRLDGEEVHKIYQHTVDHKWPAIFKFEDACYIYEYGDAFVWIDLMKDAYEIFKFKKNQFDRHLSSPPVNIIVNTTPDQIEELRVLCPNADIIKGDGSDFEILRKGVNKSTGIEVIMQELKIDWEEVFAIGDSSNDKEMVSKAKYGCAVGDAIDELKAIAKYVTKPISEDGIAEIINKLFNK
ncbi:MAG: HAD family hydrolase [Erysipelotrichaceae bacterium]